jgi:hypothetical protein
LEMLRGISRIICEIGLTGRGVSAYSRIPMSAKSRPGANGLCSGIPYVMSSVS